MLEYDRHRYKSFKDAAKINREAMDWAVNVAPVQYMAAMIDNRAMLNKMFEDASKED